MAEDSWDELPGSEIESDLLQAKLRPSLQQIREHFRRIERAGPPPPMRNPHREDGVTPAERERAVPASVLVPIVEREVGLTLLLTRRHEDISYPGHICFPGGRADPGDRDPVHTALRESHEEIALVPERVEVLGRLGHYVTHSGFRISPIVGLVSGPLSLSPRPGEVEEILEIPLEHALDSSAYRLRSRPEIQPRAYFVLEHGDAMVTGPTVSILIGLYESLLGRRG